MEKSLRALEAYRVGIEASRVAMAAASRTEAERAWVLSHLSRPPPNSAPTMALSLDQPLTVDAPTEIVDSL